MKKRKAGALSAAVIISAALVIEFSLILNRCDGGRIIREASEGTESLPCESGSKAEMLTTTERESQPLSYPDESKDGAVLLAIDNLCQLPELPTGCEVTALAAALRFYGLPADKEELALTYLPKEEFVTADGIKYGADPEECFAGDPFSAGGYGAMSSVIERTANAFLKDCGSTLTAAAVRDTDLSFFLERLIHGEPSLVWVTIDMKDSFISDSWLTRDGRQVYWQANEHCVVLAGYDEQAGLIYCADPLKDTARLTAYDAELFTERFYEMGAQGVIFT